MVDKKRVIRDYGPAMGEGLFVDDLLNPLHLRETARLDHEVDAELLAKAWERTKRVYPIIDSVLECDEGDTHSFLEPEWRERHSEDHLYLMWPAEGESHPVQSRLPLAPNTDAVGRRLVCVTYYGDTITIGAYHVLLDGRGIHMVFSTLLYAYLALYTAHEDEHPVVELREGRTIEDYYAMPNIEKLFAQGYTSVPVFQLPEGVRGFCDEDMVNDEGTMLVGTMSIDATDFMRLCKANGANPSAMIAVLLGRAAYRLNPDQQESIVFGFTISARDVMDCTDSIANTAIGGISYATRDDIEHAPIPEVAQRIRADLSTSRTHDYCVSFLKFIMSGQDWSYFTERPITYVGSFTVGDNDKHIKEMAFAIKGNTNVFMLQVNDCFFLSLHYGKATQKYLDAFVQVFDELGVHAEITQPAHPADLDVAEPLR